MTKFWGDAVYIKRHMTIEERQELSSEREEKHNSNSCVHLRLNGSPARQYRS